MGSLPTWKQVRSQLAHATEVAVICTVGGWLMGLWPGVYAGLAAWTLKEGSDVWSLAQHPDRTYRKALQISGPDIFTGYATVVLWAAPFAWITF